MRRKQLLGAALLLAACQGESRVVGESLGEEQQQGQPREGDLGSTNQWIDQIRGLQDELCMPRQLFVSEEGAVPCAIVEMVAQGGASCDCSGPGRGPVSDALRSTVLQRAQADGACATDACPELCMCEVLQATGEDRTACQSMSDAEVDALESTGWCYLDPAQGIGEPSLVEFCAASERRRVRLVGPELPGDALHYMACQSTERRVAPAALGQVCIPSSEYNPVWSSFAATELNIDTGTAACQSGTCLIQHFLGRVSCPYGQSEVEALMKPRCHVPGTSIPIEVPVSPQLVERPPEKGSFCSCRCDGPGPGPFCECPESMQCEPLFADLGIEGQADVSGSYCIVKGSEFSTSQRAGVLCNVDVANCGDVSQN